MGVRDAATSEQTRIAAAATDSDKDASTSGQTRPPLHRDAASCPRFITTFATCRRDLQGMVGGRSRQSRPPALSPGEPATANHQTRPDVHHQVSGDAEEACFKRNHVVATGNLTFGVRSARLCVFNSLGASVKMSLASSMLQEGSSMRQSPEPWKDSGCMNRKRQTPQNEKPPGPNTFHVGAAAIDGAIRLIRRPDQPCINAPRQMRLRKELLFRSSALH